MSDVSYCVQGVWMGRTIIRSKHKLTYQQAQNLVDGVPVEEGVGGNEEGRAALKRNLQALCDFADHLRQGRLQANLSPPAIHLACNAIEQSTVERFV